MQNIAQERTRVQQYYDQKRSELETNLSSRLGELQQNLMSGLNQINQARQTAASDKANRRQELLSNAQSAIAQLQTQAQQFSQSLEMWNQQRSSSLQEAQGFVLNPTDFSGLQNYAQQVSALPEVAGFAAVPQFEQAKGGYVRPGISYQKKQQEDPYTAALQAAGI
jgi:uncharacterized phage infection (PIP) family protein YhgE